MKHFLALLALLLACALPAIAGEPTHEAPPSPDSVVRVGDMAPDFDLTTLAGKPLKLSEIGKGRTTVVIFWSFFCFPCQTEMPEMQGLYEEVKGTTALAAIALDGPQYDKYVLPFVAENKLTFPIAYDRPSASFYESAEKYGVVGTPTIFVVDDSGRVRFIHLGRLDKSILKQIIEGVKSKSFCADIVKPQPGEGARAK